MSESNKQIVERINKAFMDGNTDGFLEHCTDDVVWTMEGEVTTSGKANIREWMKQMEGNIPPNFTVDKMLADGDSVVCYGTMSMTDPPGCEGAYSYCDAYTFADGKVTELRSFVVKHKAADEQTTSAAG